MKGMNRTFNQITFKKLNVASSATEIDEIVTDISGTTPANDQLPTVKAVTDYITAGGAVTNYANLSAGLGTSTALATSGIDVATGSDATYYATFFASEAITAVKMHVFLTEAYVKDTDDAVVAIKDNAETPATIFTTTLDAEGVAAGAHIEVTPEDGASAVAAGTRLDVAITATASGTGTGHVVVVLEYKI